MVIIEQINSELKLGKLDLELFSLKFNISEKRSIERSGVKYLLNEMLNNSVFDLIYDQNNKPFLAGRTEHISVSHSHKWLVITLNTKEPTGVDIELIRQKVQNIKGKFLNADELLFAGEEAEILTVIWAAKEAIFKVNGVKGISFNQHISIDRFDKLNYKSIKGKIKLAETTKYYNLRCLKFGEYILVFTINETV